mgnify:CR=1 FL=1
MKQEKLMTYTGQSNHTKVANIVIDIQIRREHLRLMQSCLEKLIEECHNAHTIRNTCYLIDDIEEILKTSSDNLKDEEE